MNKVCRYLKICQTSHRYILIKAGVLGWKRWAACYSMEFLRPIARGPAGPSSRQFLLERHQNNIILGGDRGYGTQGEKESQGLTGSTVLRNYLRSSQKWVRSVTAKRFKKVLNQGWLGLISVYVHSFHRRQSHKADCLNNENIACFRASVDIMYRVCYIQKMH